MARKTEARREQLRNRLIDIAETEIAAKGVGALRARDLASKADCSVGAIYTVFPDLTALSIASNARCFVRLGKAIETALAEEPEASPTEALVTMALAYLDFAQRETFAWRALFDVDITEDKPAPDWYRAEMEALFGYIAGPVAELFPDLDATQLPLMIRALFSSIHGIVNLSVDGAAGVVPQDQTAQMIRLLLEQFKK